MTADLIAAWRDARSLVNRAHLDLGHRETAISGWSVGQHLEHAVHAIRGCLAAASSIRRGEGRRTAAQAGPLTLSILATGRLPRGAGEAPERTWPSDDPDREHIQRLLDAARKQLAEFEGWDPEGEPAAGWIPHHELGPLDAVQWLQFAAIHLRHHLEIVGDILVAAAGTTGSALTRER